MAISYLSKPIAPGVIPSQEPIELIAQQAAVAQNKYDNVLTSIFAQYNNLLNLDTSSNSAITEKYNGLMQQSTKDLSSLATLDLTNPANIEKVESVFSPILNDVSIMGAVAQTKRDQKAVATTDYWKTKKPDLYNPLNDRFMQIRMQENRNMSEEDFNKKAHNITPIPFFDINKNLIEQAKQIPGSKDIGFDKNGLYVIMSTGDRLSEDKLMKALHLDARHMQQGEVNAYFDMYTTTPEELVKNQTTYYNKAINQYSQVNTILKGETDLISKNIETLKKLTPSSTLTADLLKQYQQKLGDKVVTTETTVEEILKYEEAQLAAKGESIKNNNLTSQEILAAKQETLAKYNALENPDKSIKITAPNSPEAIQDLKTKTYLQNLKAQVAQGMAYENISVTLSPDLEAQARSNFEYKVKEKELDAQIAFLAAQNKTGGAGGDKTNPNAPGTPNADNFTKGTTAAGGNTDESQINYLNQMKAVTEKITNAPNDLARSLFETSASTTDGLLFDNLTPAQVDAKVKQANEQLSIVGDLYDKFAAGEKDAKLGETTVTREEFFKNYPQAIAVYEAKKNNESTLATLEKIKTNIENSVPKMQINPTSRFGKEATEKGYFESDYINLESEKGGSYKIMLPPDMLKDLKAGKNTNLDLLKIYNYNISQNNIPLEFNDMRDVKSGSVPGIKQALSVDFKRFNEIMTTKQIDGGVLMPDFSPFVDTQKAKEEQFKLLSTVDRVPVFSPKPGTDEFTELVNYGVLEAYNTLEDKPIIDPKKVTNIILKEDPTTRLLMMDVQIAGAKVGEAGVTYEGIPVNPETRAALGESFRVMSDISEIQLNIDYMVKDQLARQNQSYRNSNVKGNIPETTVYFQGQKYLVAANPDGQTLTVKTGGIRQNAVPVNYFTEFLLNRYIMTDKEAKFANFTFELNKAIDQALK